MIWSLFLISANAEVYVPQSTTQTDMMQIVRRELLYIYVYVYIFEQAVFVISENLLEREICEESPTRFSVVCFNAGV